MSKNTYKVTRLTFLDEIEFVFKNDEGKTVSSYITIKDVKRLLLDKAYENLPQDECHDSSCAVNGFCECDDEYEDYDLSHLNLVEFNINEDGNR